MDSRTEAPVAEEAAPARRRAGVTAVVAVAAVALFLLYGFPGPVRPRPLIVHGNDQGPLVAGDPDLIGMELERGGDLTYGHVVLFNTTDEDAVLESVSFEPADPPGLRFLDMQVADAPDRKLVTIATGRGYPPPHIGDVGPLHPFEGTIVKPESTPAGDRGTALIMGFRFEGPREGYFRRVVVDYRIGSQRHRAKLDRVFVACEPAVRAALDGDCPSGERLFEQNRRDRGE